MTGRQDTRTTALGRGDIREISNFRSQMLLSQPAISLQFGLGRGHSDNFGLKTG